MNQEVVSNGTFWMPAAHCDVSVECRYQVFYERNHYVYRLVWIHENGR